MVAIYWVSVVGRAFGDLGGGEERKGGREGVERRLERISGIEARRCVTAQVLLSVMRRTAHGFALFRRVY